MRGSPTSWTCPATELREFRRRHGLEADGEDTGEVDLRDEIEAEIEAATLEEAEAEAEAERGRSPQRTQTRQRTALTPNGGRQQPKRRRRRRGGRSKRPGAGLQASFDHGEADGYGLWLDPAVTEDPIYSEHWAERRKVEVTIEPDRIVIVPSSDST